MIRTPIYSNLTTGAAKAAADLASLTTVPVPGVGNVQTIDGKVMLPIDAFEEVVAADPQQISEETRKSLTEGAKTSVAAGLAAEKQADMREPARDDYLTKVVKYVPGEVIVAFLGIVAAASALDANSRETALWVVFVMGLTATIGYYFLASYRQEVENQAAPYFFILAPISFFVWTVAISGDIRELFDIGERMSEVVLIGGAFAIPFLDEVLTLVFTRFHSRIPRFLQIPALVAAESGRKQDAGTKTDEQPEAPGGDLAHFPQAG